MKKFIFLFLVFVSCSQVVEVENANPVSVISDTSFTYINNDLVEDSEDFTNKKTIIVFWADY